MKIIFGILLCCLLMSIGFAASSSAAIQVNSYSTVPTAVYPGTTGQLQITLLNSGVDTATNVVVNYKTTSQNDYTQVNPGDIGPGSTATISLPFLVPQNVGSGFFVMYININYLDATTSVGKVTPVSIPIVVSQHQILAVNTGSVSPQTISPGDPLSVRIQIINTGGTMNSVVINTPTNSSFTLEGTTQQVVGDVPSNGSKNVLVNLRSSSTSTTGKYTIPLTISYQDALQNTVTQTAYVGPISVSESSAQFRIYLTPITTTEVGSEAKFALTLENRGSSSSSAVVDINQGANQSSVFTPIGPTRIYFDSIDAGQNATQTITIGVGATSAAGYYNMPITVSANGNSYVQDLGIIVEATPQVTISTSTQPQFLTSGSSGTALIQIANTGNGPIRSVYVSTASTDSINIVGATDKFVGTLNVDDSATFQLTINVRNSATQGSNTLPIKIVFKDATDQEHTIIKNVDVPIYSQSDAATYGAFSNSTGFGGRNRGGNGGLFGLGLIPTIIIAVIVIILGYFGYKRWKGKKSVKG